MRNRPLRISADHRDQDFWRLRFHRPPLICLDGQPVSNVIEARSGDEGYVTTYIHEGDRPALADVVLNGEVIDRIFATRTQHGAVTIEAMPERLS